MTERPRSSLAVWLIVGAVLLPVAYVLFTGPAVWLDDRDQFPTSAAVIYRPLEMAMADFGPVKHGMLWYTGLWRSPLQIPPPRLTQPVAPQRPKSPAVTGPR
jgi:hypothetical protein